MEPVPVLGLLRICKQTHPFGFGCHKGGNPNDAAWMVSPASDSSKLAEGGGRSVWREGSYYGALGLQVISSVKVLTDHQVLIGTGSA